MDKRIFFLILILFCSCGFKNQNEALKKIEVTVTGLDGNGEAEKKIEDAFLFRNGIRVITYNYLSNQVVFLFDTTKIKQVEILSILDTLNNSQFKILDVKENKEPIQSTPKNQPKTPPNQDEIYDETSDKYKDNA